MNDLSMCKMEKEEIRLVDYQPGTPGSSLVPVPGTVPGIIPGHGCTTGTRVYLVCVTRVPIRTTASQNL